MSALTEKVTEMAAVMQEAAKLDEENEGKEAETVAKLKFENRSLRELLHISGHPKKEIEKLKMKEYFEREKILVEIDELRNQFLELDSSADEMEHQTGTVRRRAKLPFKNDVAEDCKSGADDKSGTAEVPSVTKISNVAENPLNGCDDVKHDNNIEKQLANRLVMGNDMCNSEQVVEQMAGVESEPDDLSDDFEETDSDTDDQSEVLADAGDASAEESSEKEAVHESSATVDGNSPEVENFLDVYNSEGRLLDDTDEFLGMKRSPYDGKAGGIKIRKSNRQKKLIQADLKSFFANEVDGAADNQVKVDEVENVKNGETDDASSDAHEPALVSIDGASRDSGIHSQIMIADLDASLEEVAALEIDSDEDEDEDEEDLAMVAVDEAVDEAVEDNMAATAKLLWSRSEDDMSKPTHKTIELDFSDSDSDDPDMMIEDQFADIIAEGSNSDSSSDYSDKEDEDLEPTEMELIGDLDEGGEVVVWQWEKLEDNHERLKQALEEDDKLAEELEDATGDQVNADGPAEQDCFSFTKASLQLDQFTGGSVKAKYAERKFQQSAHRANLVTLSPDGITAAESDNEQSQNSTEGNETTENVSSESKGLFSASSSESTSSGEIDPVISNRNLSTDLPSEVKSNCADHLSELLSDLDAALTLAEDSEADND